MYFNFALAGLEQQREEDNCGRNFLFTEMTAEDCPAQEDILCLFPVLITEFLVIIIINAFTITGFAKLRLLRKRSTYLIINLTVADLLIGAITGPLFVYQMNTEENSGFTWPRFFIFTFDITFSIACQVDLCLISLDRLHATIFPFRNCLISKCFYLKIIVGSWFITSLLAVLMACLYFNYLGALSYAWASFGILTIFVLTISYVIILLNVQSSPYSPHHSLLHTERKLSVTLFIVTAVSVLTILPLAIYSSMPIRLQEELSKKSGIDIDDVLTVIYFASSIVNPLVYAIRMREFRKAIENLVCKTT